MRKRNVGGLDRCVRLMVGVILVPVGLWLSGGAHAELVGLALTVLGVMALVTGLGGYCPLYVPFGLSTAGRSLWSRRIMTRCGWRPLMEMCGPGLSTPAAADGRRTRSEGPS